MGYYIKRIVSIDKDSTPEKLSMLRDIICDVTDFNFKLYNDHLDDSNWNSGMGCSHFEDDMWWETISRKMGEVDFTVHCISEDNAIFDYICYDGNATEVSYRNTDSWYKMYIDGEAERAPGANQDYYNDPGFGEDYKYKYGEETVPAGVEWWVKK